MSDNNIRIKWKDFIEDEKYKKYFMSNIDEWKNKLEEVKKYIDDKNIRPSIRDINDRIKQLGNWINTQNYNYKKRENIMKNIIIYDLWKNFINDDKYSVYFILKKDIWNNKLNEVKKYIDENKKKPIYEHSNITEKYLGKWLSHQKYNYLKNKAIMSCDDIKQKWENFINDQKYKNYLK